MQILTIGVNHRTAPISIREKFFLNPTQRDLLLSELKSDPQVVQAFILSTCNRTEVCAHVLDGEYPEELFVQLICRIKEVDYNSGLMGYFYTYRNKEAVAHLFQVAAGLDSLIIGEKQILGQVKNAFERSVENTFFSKEFNILANLTLRAAKKSRQETHIDYGGSSISWAATTRAERELGSLENKSILIIGAGKMSKLAVGQISNKNFKKIYLMNRTIEHAETLAKTVDAEVVPFSDIKEALHEVDLCICSSSAPHYVLEAQTVQKVMSKRQTRKLVMIDISMPRNIDPKAADAKNVYLCHIDDLDTDVENNMLKRQRAVKDVELILNDKLNSFYQKIERLEQTTLEPITEIN